MMRNSLIILVILFLSTNVMAADLTPKEIFKGIQDKYESTGGIEIDFKQDVAIEGFTKGITSNGKIYIKRPDKMRWDYYEPKKQQIFIDKDQLFIYNPEENQVIRSNISNDVNSMIPFYLLTDITKIENDYNIAVEDDEASGKDNNRLVLTRKRENNSSFKVIVNINREKKQITSIVLHESNSNLSTFNFTSVKYKKGLKDDLFSFRIPKGVNVIEQPIISK